MTPEQGVLLRRVVNDGSDTAMADGTSLPRTSTRRYWHVTVSASMAIIGVFTDPYRRSTWWPSRALHWAPLDAKPSCRTHRASRVALFSAAGVEVEYRTYYSTAARAVRLIGVVRVPGEEWPTIPEATA